MKPQSTLETVALYHRRAATTVLALSVACMVALAGCKDDEAEKATGEKETRTVEKDTARDTGTDIDTNKKTVDVPPGHPPLEPTNNQMPGGMMSPHGGSPHGASSADITWKLPEGWTEEDKAAHPPMRHATLSVGEGDQRLETTVVSLAGPAGGTVMNIQRWQGQLGLEPGTEAEVEEQIEQLITASGSPGYFVDLTGPQPDDDSAGTQQAMLGAIIPWAQETWFFKAVGPKPVIDQHRDEFKALCRSVQFDTGGDE